MLQFVFIIFDLTYLTLIGCVSFHHFSLSTCLAHFSLILFVAKSTPNQSLQQNSFKLAVYSWVFRSASSCDYRHSVDSTSSSVSWLFYGCNHYKWFCYCKYAGFETGANVHKSHWFTSCSDFIEKLQVHQLGQNGQWTYHSRLQSFGILNYSSFYVLHWFSVWYRDNNPPIYVVDGKVIR